MQKIIPSIGDLPLFCAFEKYEKSLVHELYLSSYTFSLLLSMYEYLHICVYVQHQHENITEHTFT